MKKLKTGKERMFAMADAFTASMLMVLTRKSPIYIGDENLYVSEDGGVSRYEITGAMALAMTEVMDQTGNGHHTREREGGIHGEQCRNAHDIQQRQPETQLKTKGAQW